MPRLHPGCVGAKGILTPEQGSGTFSGWAMVSIVRLLGHTGCTAAPHLHTESSHKECKPGSEAVSAKPVFVDLIFQCRLVSGLTKCSVFSSIFSKYKENHFSACRCFRPRSPRYPPGPPDQASTNILLPEVPVDLVGLSEAGALGHQQILLVPRSISGSSFH